MTPLVLAAESSEVSAGFVFAMVAIVFVVALAFAIPTIVGLWKVLEKAGKPGWGAIVPYYNYWLIIEVVGRPGWWLALLFVPYANVVILVILMIDLAKSFGKSSGFGIGMAFLGFVFLPMLGFGDATYLGPSVVEPGAYPGPGGGLPPAGWYPDPWQQAPQRWWDGRVWTSHTA